MKTAPSEPSGLAAQLQANWKNFRTTSAGAGAKILSWWEQGRAALAEGLPELLDYLRYLRLDDLLSKKRGVPPLPLPADAAALSSGDSVALREALQRHLVQEGEWHTRTQRLTTRIKALREQRQTSHAELQAAEKRDRAVQAELQTRQEELRAAAAREEKALAESRLLAEQLAKLQVDLAERGRALSAHSTDLDTERQRLRAVEARNRQLLDESEQSRNKTESLDRQVAELKQRANAAEEAWRASYEQLEQVQQRETQLLSERERALSSIADLESQVAAAKAVCQRQGEQCLQVGEELSRAEQRWQDVQNLRAHEQAQRYFPSFLGQGPLAPWREKLEQRVEAGHAAAILTGAHLHLCRSEAQRLFEAPPGPVEETAPADPRPLLHSLRELSRHLYDFLAELDHDPGTCATVATEWAAALAKDFAGRVHFRIAKPGEPVSAHWMLFRSGTTVRTARTWAVGTTGAEGFKVPAEVDAGQHEPASHRSAPARFQTPSHP